MIMAVLYDTGKLHAGPDDRAGRGFNTTANVLVTDDAGHDLYAKEPASCLALQKIPFGSWSGLPARECQRKHYVRVDGRLQPTCVVCADLGHTASGCVRHQQYLVALGTISSLPSVSSTVYSFDNVAELCAGDYVDFDAADSDFLALPDVFAAEAVYTKQIVTFNVGPRGLPCRFLIDTGAVGEFMTAATAVSLGLTIEPADRPMQLRTADGRISPDPITTCVKDTHISALNGDVSARVPVMSILSAMPPMVDAIGGRSLLYGLLQARVSLSSVECYTHYPRVDATSPLVPTPQSVRRFVPFDVVRSIPTTASLAAELCGTVIPLQECYLGDARMPVEDMVILGGDAFDVARLDLQLAFATKASQVTAKRRTLPERDAVKWLRAHTAALGGAAVRCCLLMLHGQLISVRPTTRLALIYLRRWYKGLYTVPCPGHLALLCRFGARPLPWSLRRSLR
jgi:hypothetical protein